MRFKRVDYIVFFFIAYLFILFLLPGRYPPIKLFTLPLMPALIISFILGTISNIVWLTFFTHQK
jgi:hypothetical protein